MIARVESLPARAVRLRDVALAAVAAACPNGDGADVSIERHVLDEAASYVYRVGRSISHALEETIRRRAPEDGALAWLAVDLRLSRLELLAVALAAAVEDDPLVGRVLAFVQAPIGGSRPTLGLLARAFASAADSNAAVLSTLLNGTAVASGLLSVLNESAPLPERPVAIAAPLCLAIAGYDGAWPGVTLGVEQTDRVPLPDPTLAEAHRQAAALDVDDQRALVIRARSRAEGRSVALAVANALQRRPAFIETDRLAGAGPWLSLRGLIPVFCHDLAPAERRRLPPLAGYRGPVLALSGPDGFVEMAHGASATWTLGVPGRPERRELWLRALSAAVTDEATALAERLADDHRHGAGRIAHMGRLARHHAALAGRAAPRRDDVIAAAWGGEDSGLDALAEPLRGHIPDDALVVQAPVLRELEALMLRCRAREDLAKGLGASAIARYQPGVRVLFTGASGTGKTLAAGWIATRLGLPIYRVDLASVTSKYIGETEKNLSLLLSRAEQADVILLFDEADSMFGKRTDITDSNDRFANAQTNYLLQRIENYEGIVLLTSNSQGRFDDAFTRRLDFVIEFPAPGPEERRALWLSHLGPESTLTSSQLNQLSLLVDLNGGQTRNAVLAAAVLARTAGRPIGPADLLAGINVELRKLGRQVPLELQREF